MINTISDLADLIVGAGKSQLYITKQNKVFHKRRFVFTKIQKKFVEFNDIYLHGYDTQFATEENMKYMYLITYVSGKKYILEKLPKLFSGLHYTCLLYTSPSPRDRQKSRMPSSA